MSTPTYLSYDRAKLIELAAGWFDTLCKAVRHHRGQLVMEHLEDVQDVIDANIECYPHLRKEFEQLRRKEQMFAVHDCQIAPDTSRQLVELTKAWRKRLDAQMLKILAQADTNPSLFDMRATLEAELEEQQAAREALVSLGVEIRTKLRPTMIRYKLGLSVEEDLSIARDMIDALRAQCNNIHSLVA